MVPSCAPSPLRDEGEMYILGHPLPVYFLRASQEDCFMSHTHICPLRLTIHRDSPRSWVESFFSLPSPIRLPLALEL